MLNLSLKLIRAVLVVADAVLSVMLQRLRRRSRGPNNQTP